MVQLRFLLYVLLSSSTNDATDRFMRDTVSCCHFAERFLPLKHTLHHHRPVFRGNTVFRVFWPWTSFANNRRRTGVMCFIVSE
jgi:hypothetical protein